MLWMPPTYLDHRHSVHAPDRSVLNLVAQNPDWLRPVFLLHVVGMPAGVGGELRGSGPESSTSLAVPLCIGRAVFSHSVDPAVVPKPRMGHLDTESLAWILGIEFPP